MYIMINILAVWGLFGYLVIPRFPKPTTFKYAMIQLFFSGPIGWLLFVVMMLHKAVKR